MFITNRQKSGTWKVHLTIEVNFISSKDKGEEQLMNSKSDHIEVLTYDNANGIIKKIFELLLSRY